MRILYNHEWKPKRWFEIEMWLKMQCYLNETQHTCVDDHPEHES